MEPVATLAWQRALAGACAYSVATITTSPMDTLKVRLQVSGRRSSASASLGLAWQMFTKEGVGSFFAGLGPALLMAPAAAAQYSLIDPLRARLPLTLAALIAGWIDITIKCPFDRLKTHRQGAQCRDGDRSSVYGFIRDELRAHGIAGLWLGYGATLARDLPYLILKWLCYAQAQAFLSLLPLMSIDGQAAGGATDLIARLLPNIKNLAAGAIAGALAATAVTPADVVKTQMQARDDKPSALRVARELYAEGGVRGFFKGLAPRLARIPVYTAVTLATFDFIKDQFAQAAALAALDAAKSEL